MPYLFLCAQTPISPLTDCLCGYLDRAGVNLRTAPPPKNAGPDGVQLFLHHRPRKNAGAVVFYGPTGASLRFSFCALRALDQLPQLSGRVCHRAGSAGGRLVPSRVPAVLIVLGAAEPIPPEPLARALAEATVNHFRLPPVEPRPEEPVCLPQDGDRPLLRFPSALSGAYHTIPAGARLSVLGAFGDYYLARHREVVGFLPRDGGLQF